jgi:ABC-type glutathione transport system ATPase component
MSFLTLEREDNSTPHHDGEAREHGPIAVALHAVTKRYGRGHRGVMALVDVTAEFARASLSAVMGLSGSGKSTMLQLAAGLDRPWRPSVSGYRPHQTEPAQALGPTEGPGRFRAPFDDLAQADPAMLVNELRRPGEDHR